jgi:hypothetical protein
MAARLPASQRTREEVTALSFYSFSEGRAGQAGEPSDRRGGLEDEASDVLGRDYYEHGAQRVRATAMAVARDG